jgi:hypothetical protein
MLVPRSVFTLAILLVPMCSNPAETEWERRLGYLDAHLGVPVLRAPDSVSAGESFTVTVTTLGNSCTRAHGAEVGADPDFPLLRIVRPFDLHRIKGVCQDIGRTLPREVSLRFDEPGEAVIRVVGDSHPDLPGQFEARVIVR